LLAVEEIRFTKELSDIKTDQVNVELVLECELSKDGLKVEWFKDSKKILRTDIEYDIQVDGKTHRLVIKKATSKQVGTYRADYAALSTSAKVSIEGRIKTDVGSFSL
jgi:Immunoglobulin I-set domain